MMFPWSRFRRTWHSKTAPKDFLYRHMYRHRDVIREVDKAQRVVRDLFTHLNHPTTYPKSGNQWSVIRTKRQTRE